MTASRRAWLMWALGVLPYCIAVFHRASLGVAGPLAQQRFGATAAVLSLFIVLQIGVYAAMQVPVGVALDRVGSRDDRGGGGDDGHRPDRARRVALGRARRGGARA